MGARIFLYTLRVRVVLLKLAWDVQLSLGCGVGKSVVASLVLYAVSGAW